MRALSLFINYSSAYIYIYNEEILYLQTISRYMVEARVDAFCSFHVIEEEEKEDVHGAIGRDQKSFKLVWWCHQLLSGFLGKGNLPPVSRQSSRSLMIRVIMK